MKILERFSSQNTSHPHPQPTTLRTKRYWEDHHHYSGPLTPTRRLSGAESLVAFARRVCLLCLSVWFGFVCDKLCLYWVFVQYVGRFCWFVYSECLVCVCGVMRDRIRTLSAWEIFTTSKIADHTSPPLAFAVRNNPFFAQSRRSYATAQHTTGLFYVLSLRSVFDFFFSTIFFLITAKTSKLESSRWAEHFEYDDWRLCALPHLSMRQMKNRFETKILVESEKVFAGKNV
jgi:hypothetical protein